MHCSKALASINNTMRSDLSCVQASEICERERGRGGGIQGPVNESTSVTSECEIGVEYEAR